MRRKGRVYEKEGKTEREADRPVRKVQEPGV